MELKVVRTRSNQLSTLGKFFFGQSQKAVTLEDARHVPKIPGATRIPAGKYRIALRTEGGFHTRYLKRFGPDFHKGMLHLLDVPEFTFILIHCGNTVADTDGCLLVGAEAIVPSDPHDSYRIARSEDAYRTIYPSIASAILVGEEVNITIADESGEAIEPAPRPKPKTGLAGVGMKATATVEKAPAPPPPAKPKKK